MNRHPVLTIFMVIAGVILLLPGVCSLAFIVASGFQGVLDLFSLWAICFAISAGGALLLYKAFH